MDGHASILAAQYARINQSSPERPGSVTANASGFGNLLGPQPGGRARDSSSHADLSVLIATGLIGCAYLIAFPKIRSVSRTRQEGNRRASPSYR
jgi:hypothetical protein